MAAANTLDAFRYVLFDDLISCGHFYKSSKDCVQMFDPATDADKFFIFLSYRWLGSRTTYDLPDDEVNAQYVLTIQAIEEFLKLHNNISQSNVGIWVDFACIDQQSHDAGIDSLPLIIAQCDAMISLMDEEYYNRAWCCVEALMMHNLQKNYGLHLWYEYKKLSPDTPPMLRPATLPVTGSLQHKSLRFEQDRQRISFFEKQSQSLL